MWGDGGKSVKKCEKVWESVEKCVENVCRKCGEMKRVQQEIYMRKV